MSVEMSNAPEGLTIRKGLVSKIEVRVRGPKGLVRSLDRRKWTYSLDVSRLKVGENLVDIDRERIPLSHGLRGGGGQALAAYSHRGPHRQEGSPRHRGMARNLPHDYRLVEIAVQPETVEVRGAERQVKQMTQVRMAVNMDFDDPPSQWSEDVPIKLAEGVEANPGQVKVTLRFGPEVKTAWVRVPVRLETSGEGKAQSAQKHVRVQVEAPVAMLREAEMGRDIEDLFAQVVLPDGLKPGRHPVRYELKTPEGLRVLSRQSDTIDVTIRK
jgi:YbbR domain-containing protein